MPLHAFPFLAVSGCRSGMTLRDRLRFRVRRERDGKGGADAHLASHLYLASVTFNDAVGGAQSQPRSLADVFRGEKWVENPGKVFFRNALPGIREFNHDLFALPVKRGGDGQGSASVHGLCGVHRNIHEDLLEMAGVAAREGKRRFQILDDPDVVEKRLILQKEQSFGNGQIDIDRLHSRLALAGKLEKAFHNLLAASRLLDDPGKITPLLVLRGKILKHKARVDEDPPERIVDLVGDASGKLSQGRQLFRTDELHMGLLELALHGKPWPQVGEYPYAGRLVAGA